MSMAAYHRFAWQAFSFDIPADWNLAGHTTAAGVSHARFHDDFGLRLELEWMEARRPISPAVVRQRYDKLAAAMSAAGTRSDPIAALPDGWSATLHHMADGIRMVTAFRVLPGSPFFCLLKMHFDKTAGREPERLFHRLAESFTRHEEGLVPWAVYDIGFQLHRDFRLHATSFQAGRKLMVFDWRLRRLYLQFFSLADLVCREQPMEQWCAGYLKGFKALSGVTFTAGREGTLVAAHQWWKWWGNAEPLTRGCLKYRAWCRLIPEKNQLFLGVLNYRRAEDLAFLARGIEPSLAPAPPGE
jgi:hypothetical protein